MKIHYNKDFECYMVAECHKTDKIELDGVQLIPITELEKIINEILNLEDEETDLDDEYEFGMYQGYKCCELLIGNHISELKEEKKYEAEVITRGNCMMCGKELTEGLFFCKECEEKANSRK